MTAVMRGPPGQAADVAGALGALLVEHAEVADGRCDAQGARQPGVCLALLAGEALAGQGQNSPLAALRALVVARSAMMPSGRSVSGCSPMYAPQVLQR